MKLRLVTIGSGGAGQSYELTRRISGLRFSNTRPGGDESATFVLHEKWRATVPEVDRFNLVRIMYGLDVLWQGRVAERDRGGEGDEQIAVTCYGLGVRAKDQTVQVIFTDKDATAWGPASRQRHVALGASVKLSAPEQLPDTTTGLPAIKLPNEFPVAAGISPRCEALYDAGFDGALGSLYYDVAVSNSSATFVQQQLLVNDDLMAVGDATADLAAGGSSWTGTLSATAGRRFASAIWYYTSSPAGSDGQTEFAMLRNTAVFGWLPTLTKRGVAPAQGFYASDVVPYLADLAAGITVRRVDATTFVIEQLKFPTPTPHEEAITEANRFNVHDRTWGTWGPDSPLDTSADGYFDYTALEPTVAHWVATRWDLDDVDLHDDDGQLFNVAKVHYRDASGTDQVVTRTASVPELDNAGITRERRIDGGTMTTAMAQQLGDVALALFGGFAPARGSVVASRPIRKLSRGEVQPFYLRADGSNIRIPDVLPSVSLFEVSSAPDRRTTFPIKRVEVDCSGAVPSVNAELDQGMDALDALGARFEQDAELVGV